MSFKLDCSTDNCDRSLTHSWRCEIWADDKEGIVAAVAPVVSQALGHSVVTAHTNALATEAFEFNPDFNGSH